MIHAKRKRADVELLVMPIASTSKLEQNITCTHFPRVASAYLSQISATSVSQPETYPITLSSETEDDSQGIYYSYYCIPSLNNIATSAPVLPADYRSAKRPSPPKPHHLMESDSTRKSMPIFDGETSISSIYSPYFRTATYGRRK